MDRVICLKCDHDLAEHQPSYGYRPYGSGAGTELVGCAICDCVIPMTEKVRGWQRRGG